MKKTYDLKIVESFDNSMVADDEKENTKFEETSELISQYIDATDTLLDKSILKSQLKELYNEALYAERL